MIPLPEDVSISEPGAPIHRSVHQFHQSFEDPRNIPLPLDPMLEPVNSQDQVRRSYLDGFLRVANRTSQDTSDQLVLPGTFSAERWVHRLAGEYRDDSKSIGLEGDASDASYFTILSMSD